MLSPPLGIPGLHRETQAKWQPPDQSSASLSSVLPEEFKATGIGCVPFRCVLSQKASLFEHQTSFSFFFSLGKESKHLVYISIVVRP